jgi:hypothetical protein
MKEEVLEKLIKGDRLRVAVCATEEGRMLKITLMGFGGVALWSFYTNSNYLAVNRNVLFDILPKLQVELNAYYGEDCDLVFKHTKNVFDLFALFDVSMIWRELGYIPRMKYNLAEYRKILAEWKREYFDCCKNKITATYFIK